MRKSVLLIVIVGAFALLSLCGGIALVAYYLTRPDQVNTALTGVQKVRVADGSEIAYPSSYEALDVRDPEALIEIARKSLREPARSLLITFSDRAIFAARSIENRMILVAGRDAFLEEVPESEREAWRAQQEDLYRQAFEGIAEAIRSSAPDAEVTLDGMTWLERKGSMDVLEIRFSYRQGERSQNAWMAIVFFPRRIYDVLSVGNERAFRVLLESSRFAPEREESARALPTPTATRRVVSKPTPTPAPTVVTPFAFPSGWKVLTPEEIQRLVSPESVPPEVRPYVEIVRQGAQAVAYDPKSPGSLIIVMRQGGSMTQEQADLIQESWENVSEMLSDSMRSFMESAGWEDILIEPAELFDHRPSRGRAALLAVRFQGSGTYMGVNREFRSVILYFEDVTWVVTALDTDWKILESVLKNSRW